jgi:hypothetical protein
MMVDSAYEALSYFKTLRSLLKTKVMTLPLPILRLCPYWVMFVTPEAKSA